MSNWITTAKTIFNGLITLCVGAALTACVETTYTTMDGQVTTTTQTEPAYRMVMTPNGLRVITPEGYMINPEQAPASVDVTQLQTAATPVIAILLPLSGSDRKSTRLNSSHSQQSRMPSSA